MATTPKPQPEAQGPAFTIDELSARTRVPSRTIRFYQSKGALTPPEIRGRVAYYGPLHIERLELIAKLHDRGLRIDAIGDLVKRIDRGELDLAQWLGVEAQMEAPWADDQARTVTEAELYAIAGSQRPGLLADLMRSGIVERRGDVYLVASPALLGIGMKLEAVGVDAELAMEAAGILRKHLKRAVADLVTLFLARVKSGAVDVTDTGKLFETLRQVGPDSVRLLFGHAMEKALREVIASGKLADVASPKGRKKR